jgi:hypothetical protein
MAVVIVILWVLKYMPWPGPFEKNPFIIDIMLNIQLVCFSTRTGPSRAMIIIVIIGLLSSAAMADSCTQYLRTGFANYPPSPLPFLRVTLM